MKFKEYLQYNLSEAIYVDKGKLIITIQKDARGSSKGEISTFLNPTGIPYKTAGKRTNNVPVYSIYSYKPASSAVGDSTDILQSLKGKGPYTVEPIQVEKFIERSVAWLSKQLSTLDIDTVVYPKSSSQFLQTLINKVREKFSSFAYIDDAFVKREHDDAEEYDHLLHKGHPDFDKLDDKSKKQLLKQVEKIIRSNAEAGKGSVLSIKDVYKPFAKFIKDFLEVKDGEELLEAVLGKNVLIVDDILSTGTTFNEMVRLLQDLEPTSIQGLTVFKSESE